MLDVMHDCFGRQRHKDHREDMTGVGAYDDPCRTLYVGGLKRVPGYDIDKAVYIYILYYYYKYIFYYYYYYIVMGTIW